MRKRPIAPSIQYGLKHFERIWAADGSVLEALFLKLESLKDLPPGALAGRICARNANYKGLAGQSRCLEGELFPQN